MTAGPSLEELFTARLAVLLADAVDHHTRAEARARFDRAGYQRYRGLDRGSYETLDAAADPLVPTLSSTAARLAGRPLTLVDARALRLSPGDYLLSHHDRPHDAALVEAMVDLSAATVAGAVVHYRRRGQPFFELPAAPGTLAVVERDAAVRCNHGYVTKRAPHATVVRLVLRLRG
jgi:hypothetical protein